MKVGSLFTGIGGLDLGLERAGMEIRWQVEIDPFCRAVLEKHWPHVPKYGDIREVKGDELEPVDLICGGFPCQPISVAGRRLGEADPRWLWPEFARIVRVVRPKYVLVENVPGLLVRGMGGVLGDLAALGYDAEWDCIPAAAVGAPHLRDRVFIVAYPHGYDLQTRVFEPSRARATKPSTRWGPDKPGVDRALDGVPRRVDRLRALGNAVVPQVAEWIGRMIMEFAKEERSA